MSRKWPRCSEPGCTNVVREVAGDYRGKRQPEPDGKCSAHKIEDTEYVPPTPTPPAAPQHVHTPDPEEEQSSAGSERIASLRDSLRENVVTAEVAELVREQLLEALRASKITFATCPDCGHRHPVLLPDLSTRINATQKLIEEVEGKLQASQADTVSELERRGRELTKETREMSDEELALRIALLENELANERS